MIDLKKAVSFVLSIIVFSTAIFVDSCDKALVTVDFLKTGSSDCIIIKTKNHSVLIDTAYSESFEIIENKLYNLGVNTLDYLILTHYDKDHIGSASKVLTKYSPKEVFVTYDKPKVCSKAHKDYLKTINKHKIIPTVVNKQTKLNFDDVELLIIPPKKKLYSRDVSNNSSLVVAMRQASCSFLFSADVEYERIEEMLAQNIGHYDVLKVPHHGWYEKNTSEFIEKVSPKYSVVTNVNGYRKIPRTVSAIISSGSYLYTTAKGAVTVKCYDGYFSVYQNYVW